MPVGYEMVNSQRGAQRRGGYNYPISNKCEWNNCFIKNTQRIQYLSSLAVLAVAYMYT